MRISLTVLSVRNALPKIFIWESFGGQPYHNGPKGARFITRAASLGLHFHPGLYFLLGLILPALLSAVCLAEKSEPRNYVARWWWHNANQLTKLGRVLLGEDPVLLSGHFEGDVVLPAGVAEGPKAEGSAEEKNAVVSTSLLWPDGIVPYDFSNGYDILPFEKFLIIQAMRDIEERSCVKFVRRTDEYDYVKIIFDTYKCYSNIGRVGGEQVLSLGFFCVMFYDKGNVYHELFHVLGFHHEHNRPDRDDYIDVMWRNIKQEARKNFQRRSSGSVDLLDLPYDIDSVMHYSPHAFSKVYYVLPTIVSHQKGIFFTRKRWPSKIDYAKLNTLYECQNRRHNAKAPHWRHRTRTAPPTKELKLKLSP